MNIIEHSRSDIVAVCHRDTLGCRVENIQRSNLQLWKLDIDSLLNRTARSLAATHQDWFHKNIEKIDRFNNFWRLGKYVAYDNQEYLAFILLTDNTLELLNVLRFITITFDKNFLIIAPLKIVVDASVEEEIHRFTNIFLALEDIFVENSEYGLELSGNTQQKIYNWILQFSPYHQRKIEYFPHFPDLEWNQIRIKLLNVDKIQVTVQGSPLEPFDYIQMGGSAKSNNADNKKPKALKVWNDFIYFIDKLHYGGHKISKDNKRRLKKFLQAFFGRNNPKLMNDDPIRSEVGGGYIPLFGVDGNHHFKMPKGN